jgi:hypothetical protein
MDNEVELDLMEITFEELYKSRPKLPVPPRSKESSKFVGSVISGWNQPACVSKKKTAPFELLQGADRIAALFDFVDGGQLAAYDGDTVWWSQMPGGMRRAFLDRKVALVYSQSPLTQDVLESLPEAIGLADAGYFTVAIPTDFPQGQALPRLQTVDRPR